MTASLHCPVCNGSEVTVFLRIPRAPVFCNQLCHTRGEALQAPTAEIRLGYCSACGHVYNTAFDPGLLEYSPEYENSLHFSPRFQGYADELAAQLRTRYDLSNKTVVEIGCGRGDFLKALCRDGDNHGFGFDPGYPGESGVADPETGVTVFRQGYSEVHADLSPDLICCRHCLEHIDAPRGFLDTLRDTFGPRAAVFFEVPNVLYTLRDGGIWDIIYEHCGYFSPGSLGRVFEAAGFGVAEVTETFGGQFLTLHGSTGQDRAPNGAWRSLDGMEQHVARFAELYREKIEGWRTRLQAMAQDGRKAMVWGAGSKGNTFLNVLQPGNAIEYVVDINPRKHGKFVVGTGQEIVAPEFLRDYRPDIVIVMNPIYSQEIRQTTEALGLGIEFLYA